jgi:hypothetical protein
MTEPARIAKLIRMLASDNDGEVLTAARMLKKLTSLTALGDQVEKGSSGVSDRDKQLIRNAAYAEGLRDGIRKGQRNARPQRPFDTSFNDGVKRTHARAGVHIETSPAEMVSYCLDCRAKLSGTEREFLDSLEFRIESSGYLSEKQRKWLSDIYERLGGQ